MQLCDLTLQYDGVRVLEHLNLTLPDSGLVCIFAPSGTGKTTLLNLFCGLLKPDSGRIEGLEDRKFAYVFQEDRLVPQLTARENIRLVMERNHWKSSIYIGDTEGDRKAALTAGIPVIHAAYGFGQVQEASRRLQDIRELPSLLRSADFLAQSK